MRTVRQRVPDHGTVPSDRQVHKMWSYRIFPCLGRDSSDLCSTESPTSSSGPASRKRWSSLRKMTCPNCGFDPTGFWQNIEKTADGCWLWKGSSDHGYGRVRSRGEWAHRIAFRLVKGPIPDGFLVMHLCDNRPCINPDHLVPSTPTENVRDAVQKGRHRHGILSSDQVGTAKLSWKDVSWIRKENYPRGTLTPAATRYGLSRQAFSDIIHEVRWTDFPLQRQLGA